jgi:hypothetical protein
MKDNSTNDGYLLLLVHDDDENDGNDKKEILDLKSNLDHKLRTNCFH